MSRSPASSGWRIWIDRGGTFTDIVAEAPDRSIRTGKLLSESPGAYRDAAVEGIRRLLCLAPGEPVPENAIEHVKMGTTVATNALLEREGDRTLYVTTAGFGDLLRIGYQNRPRLFDLHVVLPEPLYERAVEVPERMGVDGSVIQPLDEASLRQALAEALDAGICGVAIAFPARAPVSRPREARSRDCPGDGVSSGVGKPRVEPPFPPCGPRRHGRR